MSDEMREVGRLRAERRGAEHWARADPGCTILTCGSFAVIGYPSEVG
jgi:hypothetical protein